MESQFAATLTVHHPQGDIVLQMETLEGGGIEVSAGEHRNPVTRKSGVRSGTKNRAAVKVTCECTAEVWNLLDRLEDSANVDRCTIVRQMVDGRGAARPNTKNKPITGILGTVTPPNFDINSNDVGMLEIEVNADE